jgi:hypothetical protein
VPLAARISDDATVVVEHAADHNVRTIVLFERDGDRVGYRLVRGAASHAAIERPVLTDSIALVRQDLRALLIEVGLYPADATAMLETWRDTWFEPGVRVFYLVPRAFVDAVLPLTIHPAPLEVTRVFVGRIELHVPAARAKPSNLPACTPTTANQP